MMFWMPMRSQASGRAGTTKRTPSGKQRSHPPETTWSSGSSPMISPTRRRAAGEQFVVRAEPGVDVPVGVPEALVQPIGLPLVGLGDEHGDPVPVAIDRVTRGVGAAGVGDDDLEIGVVLVEHAADRPLEALARVEIRDHQADPRRARGGAGDLIGFGAPGLHHAHRTLPTSGLPARTKTRSI